MVNRHGESAVFLERRRSVIGIVPTIEADLAAGHGMGISGVPAVVFNGTLLGVPPDSARLFKMIDDVLARTR